MKLSRLIVIPGVFALIMLLKIIVPTEEEQELRKMDKFEERNFMEKPLVGKWNHSDFPAGLDNDRNYHLLSADGGYAYRGSDNSKWYGGSWHVELADSILYLDISPRSNSKVYKVLCFETDHVSLQKIENDQAGRVIEWFRHP